MLHCGIVVDIGVAHGCFEFHVVFTIVVRNLTFWQWLCYVFVFFSTCLAIAVLRFFSILQLNIDCFACFFDCFVDHECICVFWPLKGSLAFCST